VSGYLRMRLRSEDEARRDIAAARETEARERLASGLEASADMLERSQWSQAPHIQKAIVELRMRARVIRRARESEWYRSLSPDAEARAIEDG
jgi:hypothetical protein